MAITKRVIILEQIGTAPLSYRYVLWADVPVQRQAMWAIKQAGITSAWGGASAGDNTALTSGSVAERVDTTIMQSGDTLSTVQTRLQNIWTAYQAEINAYDPWLRYGSFMDTSNSWTAGGVS